jgi:glycine/D-amino acid oxidase-like deaminating enzyme
VVGAGVIGLAVAFQLRRAGVADVLVVDRNSAPGMGSTGRANGGVRAQFSTSINVAFSQYTIAGLIDLDGMTVGLAGYRPVGYLFMAGTDLSAESLHTSMDMQRSLGVPTQWLSPEQVAQIAPFVRLDGLRRHRCRCASTSTPASSSAVRGGGILIGYSDPASTPSVDTSFEPEFLDAVASRVGNRFPFLERATINPHKCWAGLYPDTPDHIAIIDAPREAPWFIQCAGFGGHGIMHSLAAGQAVAELIRDQRCSTFDLSPLRLDRFGESSPTVETAIL